MKKSLTILVQRILFVQIYAGHQREIQDRILLAATVGRLEEGRAHRPLARFPPPTSFYDAEVSACEQH